MVALGGPASEATAPERPHLHWTAPCRGEYPPAVTPNPQEGFWAGPSGRPTRSTRQSLSSHFNTWGTPGTSGLLEAKTQTREGSAAPPEATLQVIGGPRRTQVRTPAPSRLTCCRPTLWVRGRRVGETCRGSQGTGGEQERRARGSTPQSSHPSAFSRPGSRHSRRGSHTGPACSACLPPARLVSGTGLRSPRRQRKTLGPEGGGILKRCCWRGPLPCDTSPVLASETLASGPGLQGRWCGAQPLCTLREQLGCGPLLLPAASPQPPPLPCSATSFPSQNKAEGAMAAGYAATHYCLQTCSW